MKHYLIILFFLSVHYANAQRGEITVTITSEQKTSLENATVELLRSKDSSLVKAAVADKTGNAVFESIPFGLYVIRTSLVNHATHTNYHEFLTAQRDTRVVNLSFTYRFGKNTVAQSRRRTTASEEERRRAQ